MSWTSSTTIPRGTEPREIENLLAQAPVYGGTAAPAEQEEQIRAAREAARFLLTSGVLGGEEEGSPVVGYSVQLSGHVNPGHVPREGWSNSAVTVSVAQIVPAKKAVEAAVAAVG